MQSKRRKLRNEMTYCEKIVWLQLRIKQMGVRFLSQFSIDNYVIDFYCPKLKLAVEVDGDIHNDPEQIEYDKQRQSYLEKYGFEFIRISNLEINQNPNKAFSIIEEKIEKHMNRKEI